MEDDTNITPGDGSQPTSRGSASQFDLGQLRLSQNFGAAAGVKKLVTTVQVRKPNRQEFVRVHPESDYCIETVLLEFKDEGETFLVAQELWQELGHELVPKVLYTTINRQGVLRLWPIRLPDVDGRLDDWNRSALLAAEIAKKQWVRVSSNRAAGAYETYSATGELPEPEWPELTFNQIVEIAFGEGRFITSLDHPAVRKLREGT